ncbi:MAG TPA: D-2-hydroxyacid dehydrogenase, partial [Bacteroidetes bacterium]|nr:D-2-hydroxyacid dehydrogenase [Bacteroidota bacterium]
MNIVVLDGFCINPGDLDWSELKKLGNVEIYDRTPDYKLMGYASGAHILLVNKTYIDNTNISAYI